MIDCHTFFLLPRSCVYADAWTGKQVIIGTNSFTLSSMLKLIFIHLLIYTIFQWSTDPLHPEIISFNLQVNILREFQELDTLGTRGFFSVSECFGVGHNAEASSGKGRSNEWLWRLMTEIGNQVHMKSL